MSVAPKRPKGAPLNAMRAFEAAARHESFVLAAEELNVTAGAISQHIKTLEGWAGITLFRRNAQGVELTSAGRALVKPFTEAFDGLGGANRMLRSLNPNADFQIAALPSVAQLWLPRRLGRIRETFPKINFSVTALEAPPNLSRELFDLSIFFTSPDDSLNRFKICEDIIQPVCTPHLLEKVQKHGLETLAHLHDLSWEHDWVLWAESVGIQFDKSWDGPQFSLYSLAVEEAKTGAGLLMGHLCLIEDLLNDGLLVSAHPHSIKTGRALTVEIPEQSLLNKETRQIADLLCVC